MDVALFAASGSLSVYLPRCVFSQQSWTEQSSMAVAIGLSLGLFSLSLLEMAPSSFLFLLSLDANNDDVLATGFFTVSRGYRILLWTMSFVILVVFPSMAGFALAETIGRFFPSISRDRDDNKYPLFVQAWRTCPWWLRFLGGLVKIFVKNFCRFLWKVCLPHGPKKTEPALVMTINDEEIRQTSSHDIEMRGFVSSPKKMNTMASSRSRFMMILGGVCGVAVVLATVSSLGPLVLRTPSDKGSLSMLVSWMCAVGLCLSSILNGFGSVSVPYTCLAGRYLKPVRPEIIAKMEGELKNVKEALEKKKSTVREMTLAIRQGRANTNSGNTRNVYKLASFSDYGEELASRKQIMQTEIDFLENLYKDIGEDIDELKHSQMLASLARTTMGRVKSYIGLVFSVILLVRLASAAVNIWQSYTMDTDQHKVADGDIITTILIWLAGHNIVSQGDYAMLSQVVSLGLAAILSFTQVRTFLRTVAAVNRRLNRFYQICYSGAPCSSRKAGEGMEELSDHGSYWSSTGFHAHLIAAATGCYCLSCIVLIKMMLPYEFCEGLSTALGGMDVFTIHTSAVNTVFACSAGTSAAILGMLFGIQRQNNYRHTSSMNNKVKLGADLC